MTPIYRTTYRRFLRFAAFLCWATAALGMADTALGLSHVEVYQATVPVSDRSETAQATAFQAAMRVVLIRVTGRRNAEEDAALAPLLTNSRRYVQQYRGTSDNKLWVAFDGAAIERWLTQNGQPLWGRERPSTLVWLSVQAGPQAGALLTAEDSSELKQAVDTAASLRGVPLIWPESADLQKSHLDASAGTTAVLDLAHTHGADAVLLGKANDTAATASVRWTHLFQDHSSEFSGALEGINRAADIYAGVFAASGAVAPVDIEVSGVADLRAYAGVQSYLESLTFITGVSVEALSGDAVQFRLLTRGGIEALQHALALSGKLQALPASEGIQRFQLRR